MDAKLAAGIPDLRRIVAFRNILIHGYAIVDDALVWQVLTDKIPGLAKTVRALLEAGGTSAEPGSRRYRRA